MTVALNKGTTTAHAPQVQPSHLAESAQSLLHTLRFYEALTELTSASAALLRRCDGSVAVQHADAVALVANVARAVEQCAAMLGGQRAGGCRDPEATTLATFGTFAVVRCMRLMRIWNNREYDMKAI